MDSADRSLSRASSAKTVTKEKRVPSSSFAPFATLRRSLRDVKRNASVGALLRLPGTPRVVRANKGGTNNNKHSSVTSATDWSYVARERMLYGEDTQSMGAASPFVHKRPFPLSTYDQQQHQEVAYMWPNNLQPYSSVPYMDASELYTYEEGCDPFQLHNRHPLPPPSFIPLNGLQYEHRCRQQQRAPHRVDTPSPWDDNVFSPEDEPRRFSLPQQPQYGSYNNENAVYASDRVNQPPPTTRHHSDDTGAPWRTREAVRNNVSEISLLHTPPTPEEAQHDIFAHIQSLLSPVKSPNFERKMPARKQLIPGTPKLRTKPTENETNSVVTRQLSAPDYAVLANRNRPESHSMLGGVKASQESLISLMSGGGGRYGGPGSSSSSTSFWHSPLIPPRTPLGRADNRRSMASDSSRGSGDTCRFAGKKSSVDSRRSYPLNGLFPPPPPTLSRPPSHVSSGLHTGSTCVNRGRQETVEGLELKAQFTLETCTHFPLDTPFVGREWVFRDLHENLLRQTSAGVAEHMVIQGESGSGKTTIVRQLIEQSPFYSNSLEVGSADSGIVTSSRLSLYQSPSQTSIDWLSRVGARIVAYHFCQIESGAACSVPEFVCNLGALLANAPLLRSYAECLVKQPLLQERLNLEECLKSDAADTFAIAICGPLRAIRPPEDGPCIIVVDGLDEAEFHRPESTDSILSFLMKYHSLFPTWLRLLVTVRTEFAEPLNSLGWRRLNLDDAVLDERVARDARLYIDRRLSASESLRRNVTVTTGLSDTDHPLLHFAHHISSVGRGNLLYLRLCLDLLEQGIVRLKTANYSALPVSLPEVFLLWFNRKYATQYSFEKVVPILSVMLASLRPLDVCTLRDVVNAGHVERYLSEDDFVDRVNSLAEFLVRRLDGTLAPFHSAFRDWLMRKQEGYGPKFLADVSARDNYLRQGHVLLALWLSRRPGERLNSDGLFELGHHLLKAHPYKYNVTAGADDASEGQLPMSARGASGRDCQLVWIQQTSADLAAALCSRRNVACPNTKVSRLLLLAGAAPNACLPSPSDPQHQSPLLLIASELGRSELVALLLEFDADVDARETAAARRTATMAAAAAGHLDVVQILHQHGARLGKVDDQGRCALVHAAEGGRVEVASFLLQCDWAASTVVESQVTVTDKNAAVQSAFVVAAANGRTKMCQFLLEMADGIDLEGADRAGTTALMAACESAQSETVHYLLGQGANVGASIAGEQMIRRSPLISAVRGGSWEIVSGLLARGLDVNAERDGEDRRTPLMVAASNGHIGVAELLLSRGASVDARDGRGLTALSYAARGDQPSCATLLLDRGAVPTTADHDQLRTPLHHAAECAGKHMVHLLLERGSPLESVDQNELRPLDIAVSAANANALQSFLRKGAKLSSRTWELARAEPDIALLLLQKLVEDGNLLYRRGRLKEASHRFSYALKKCSSHFLQMSDFPRSTLTAVHAEKLKLLHYALLLGLGRCKRRQTDHQVAIECCNEALICIGDCGGFEAYFLRAKCHFDRQDMTKATADARTALRLNPTSVDGRYLLETLLGKDSNRGPLNVVTGAARLDEVGSPDVGLIGKSASPAECSSDSGNQADFEEGRLKSGLETEL